MFLPRKLLAVLAVLTSPAQVWGAGSQEAPALRGLSSSQPQPRQVLVFDAGSSGTRIHIFNILPGAKDSLAPRIDLAVRDQQTKKLKPGLSGFAENNDFAGVERNIEQLLEFASQWVPADRRSSTPALLKATAGLRSVKPAEKAEAILQRVRETLAKSGYLFKMEWADIIKGKEEAGLAWVAANYLQGNFLAPPTRSSSVGIIEMGGGSTQVTFEVSPSEAVRLVEPDDFVFNTLTGTKFHLYAHSYLGYGQDHAQAKMRVLMQSTEASGDPCYPGGYIRQSLVDAANIVQGTGNAQMCQEYITMRLFADTETLAPSQYAEELALRGRFVATENFFYLREDLKFPMHSSIRAMKAAADTACKTPLHPSSELEAAMRAGTENFAKQKHCFGLCYQAALMEALGADKLGLGQVQIARNIKGGDIDWALGAALVHFIENFRAEEAAKLAAFAAQKADGDAQKLLDLEGSSSAMHTVAVVSLLVVIALCAARLFLGPTFSKQVVAVGSAIGASTIGSSRWIELGARSPDLRPKE